MSYKYSRKNRRSLDFILKILNRANNELNNEIKSEKIKTGNNSTKESWSMSPNELENVVSKTIFLLHFKFNDKNRIKLHFLCMLLEYLIQKGYILPDIDKNNESGYKITIIGKMFIESGGYSGRKITTQMNFAFKFFSTILFLIGTVFGIIVSWNEVQKYNLQRYILIQETITQKYNKQIQKKIELLNQEKNKNKR